MKFLFSHHIPFSSLIGLRKTTTNTINNSLQIKHKINGVLLLTRLIWLKNTCKLPKYLSTVNCRDSSKPTAVNYQGKPRQLTAEELQTQTATGFILLAIYFIFLLLAFIIKLKLLSKLNLQTQPRLSLHVSHQ